MLNRFLLPPKLAIVLGYIGIIAGTAQEAHVLGQTFVPGTLTIVAGVVVILSARGRLKKQKDLEARNRGDIDRQ